MFLPFIYSCMPLSVSRYAFHSANSRAETAQKAHRSFPGLCMFFLLPTPGGIGKTML